MASAADAPTLPASLRVVESVLLTVSTVALVMSPPPLTALTMPSFTVSIIPECSVFMLALLLDYQGSLLAGALLHQLTAILWLCYSFLGSSMVMLLTTLFTP